MAFLPPLVQTRGRATCSSYRCKRGRSVDDNEYLLFLSARFRENGQTAMAYVHAKALVASFAKVIQWLAITKLRNQQAGCKGKKTGSSNQRRLNTALMDFSATACRLPLTIKGASMLRFGPRHGFVFFILTIGLLLSACGGSSVHVTAKNATLVSIGVTPANPNLPQGLTGQFTATWTYSDNITQDLTAQLDWSSSIS